MKSLRDMTPAELRCTIKAFAVKVAVQSYKKENPGCAESSAWAWASRHWVQFQEVGESCVIAVELHREKAAYRAN